MRLTPHLRLLLGSAAFTVLSAATPLVAQAQTDASADEEEVEEVIVVGTNITGVKPVGSEAVVVGREDAVRAGLSNVADVVRRIPQVQMGVGDNVGFQGGTAQQGYNGAQTETINLRGLGATATLVLIDGRRPVGSGAVSTTTEANQIPLAALERIEVLPDGASALYGSDAVAGVVNFVIRKNFEGVEASVRYGDTYGGDEWQTSITAGAVWPSLMGLGEGNLIVTYEHQDREAFRAGQIARLRQDLRPLGGPDLRINNDTATVGFAPNIISQGAPNTAIPRAGLYTYWGVPAGAGTGLTAANLLLNQPNLADSADHQDWVGEQTRDQVALYFNQDLTPNLELFGNAYYSNRETSSLHPSPTIRVPLAGSPFFIAGLPANQIVQYSTLKDGQTRRFSPYSETIGAVIGLRADMFSDWHAEGYYNYGRNEQCDSCVTGAINTAALTAQVRSGAINPLSSAPLNASQIASVYGTSTFESRTILHDWLVKADGPLFALPAGMLRAAIGGEFRTEQNANRNRSTTGPTNVLTTLATYGATQYERDITSVFAELYVPVISEEMNVPLVKSLTLSAAARYDDYSDVGGTTNPRYGFTWDVTDELRFSGSWGTSFRAPSVTDSNPNAVTSGTLFPGLPNFDPRIRNGVLPAGILGPFGLTNAALMLGSNPDLEPEESENWSLTGSWRKGGLNLNVTYWSISFDNQIAFPGVLIYLQATPADVPANGGDYRGWGRFVIPINNPATCNNADPSTADPALQPFLDSLNYDFVAGGGGFSQGSSLRNDFCRVNVVLDSRLQNVAHVEQSGVDVSASYFTTIGDVSLEGRLAVSRVLENELTAGPGQTPSNHIGELDQGNSGFKWRATAGVTAQWNGFDATLTARYVHKLKATGLLDINSQLRPDQDLDSHTEIDLTLGYNHDFDNPVYGLKSWRAQLAVTNVFDDEPPFFANSGGAWNPKYGLPYGRTYSVQLTGRF